MAFAVVFPGQGSQSVGMLSSLAERYSLIHECFAEASSVLGYDLWTLVQQGPKEHLNQTEFTQPAVLTGGVAVWRVWRSLGGGCPDYMAGHSLGEYTALVCAESLAFADALQLVAARGRFMQEAVPSGHGAMAAIIGLEDEKVAAACAAVHALGYAAAANYNAPGQVVIAGEAAAVTAAGEAAKAAGARKVMPLPVSVPSHCNLMLPAAERLAPLLEQTAFVTPKVPVLHNVDGEYRDSAAAIRLALTRQLHQPVCWTGTIEKLEALAVQRYAECGPGKVLTGLIKRISRSAQVLCWQEPEALGESLAQWLN